MKGDMKPETPGWCCLPGRDRFDASESALGHFNLHGPHVHSHLPLPLCGQPPPRMRAPRMCLSQRVAKGRAPRTSRWKKAKKAGAPGVLASAWVLASGRSRPGPTAKHPGAI